MTNKLFGVRNMRRQYFQSCIHNQWDFRSSWWCWWRHKPSGV